MYQKILSLIVFLVFLVFLVLPSLVLAQPAMQREYGCTSAVGTDAYACTPGGPASYTTGRTYWFIADVGNTGAATFNVDAIGAKTIKKLSGNITTDLATGDICVGQTVAMKYDGTNMQMTSPTCPAAGGSDLGTRYVGQCTAGAVTGEYPGLGSATGTCITNGAFSSSSQQLIPVSGALSTLRCHISNAVIASQTATFLVRTGAIDSQADSSLTCTMNAGEQDCSDVTHSVSVTAGDAMQFRTNKSATNSFTGYYQCTAVLK